MATGTGNGTRDRTGRRTAGVLTDRVIGTYLHGPIVARNPALADHILTAVTGTTRAPHRAPRPGRAARTYLDLHATRKRLHLRRRIPKHLSWHG